MIKFIICRYSFELGKKSKSDNLFMALKCAFEKEDKKNYLTKKFFFYVIYMAWTFKGLVFSGFDEKVGAWAVVLKD